MKSLWLAGLATVSGMAAAAPIAIVVQGEGTALKGVALSDERGLTAFAKSPDGSFHGTIDSDSFKPQAHVLIISYPDFKLPVRLRLHQLSRPVTIPVELTQIGSCTQRHVIAVEGMAPTLPDAINRFFRAGRLLNIAGNDACDAALSSRAAQALYKSSVRMNHLSKGLFAIPDEVADLYIEKSADPATARRVVAEYQQQAIGLEAVQLASARDDAQGRGDFAAAASIQDVLAEQISESSDTREAYKEVGLTEDRVMADKTFLDARAERSESVEVQAER